MKEFGMVFKKPYLNNTFKKEWVQPMAKENGMGQIPGGNFKNGWETNPEAFKLKTFPG